MRKLRRSQEKRKPRARMKNRCEICGSPASHVCPICGRSVCDRHWVGDKCVICAETLCAICRTRLSIATCAICGRLVCEECSIQVTPVVRVCKECLEKYRISEWPPRGLVQTELYKLSSSIREFLQKWGLSIKL